MLFNAVTYKIYYSSLAIEFLYLLQAKAKINSSSIVGFYPNIFIYLLYTQRVELSFQKLLILTLVHTVLNTEIAFQPIAIFRIRVL